MPILDLRELSRRHMPQLSCPEVLKAAAIATWRGRMINEHGSARVFVALAAQLAEAGALPKDVQSCRGFAEEERRHGVLCGAVVEALGAEARAQIEAPEEYPLHRDAEPLEAALRNLLSISCLSETVAVALIGAERLEMPEGELHTLLTQIYADECGHCNFGWRLLPTLLPKDSALLARLADYLRVAFSHLEQHELRHLPVEARWPEQGAAIGLCNGSDARALFYSTVEQVIIPGLEAHGIAAGRAWAERSALARQERARASEGEGIVTGTPVPTSSYRPNRQGEMR